MASAGRRVVSVLLLGAALWGTACASEESLRARAAAADGSLRCSESELEAGLNRETPKVREYIVGCNFVYTRVLCTDQGCRRAPPKPPCMGNLPCFEEDPVTLEWKLETARR
jgi:hypothetical protein